MRTIIHQSQPTSLTCMSTCLAMLLELPVEEVVEKFHNQYQLGETRPSWFLEEHNQPVTRISAEEPLHYGCVYICIVPEPTMTTGNTHAVIVDLRGEDMEVFDPAKGYSSQFYGEGGRALKGNFVPLLRIEELK